MDRAIEMLVGMASLPHSGPLQQSNFTVETGKNAYTFGTQYTFSEERMNETNKSG